MDDQRVPEPSATEQVLFRSSVAVLALVRKEKNTKERDTIKNTS